MVSLSYPGQTIISYELIDCGCVNLNYKIQLKDEIQPLILRVYLRDKDAAYREEKLASLIKEDISVSLTHYIGELEGYHFAIKATLRTVVTMKILKTSLIMQPNFAIKRWFFKFLISNSMI